jgi:hypothetical protein
VINKVAYDFENIRIAVGGTEITGVSSIDYSSTVESEKEFGSDREAYDATEGFINVEDVEMELKEYEYRNLIERLGPGYMRKKARFDISVSYAHEGEPVYTDALQRCRIIGDAHNPQQGAEGLMVSLTLQVMKILKGTSTGQIDPMAATA